MKEELENYDVFLLLAAITIVSILMKIIGTQFYKRLLRESGQMGTTGNRWLKAMMAKFEAYYKLQISIHNVENFVDHYLYQYHFCGFTLDFWERAGYRGTLLMLGLAAMAGFGAGYLDVVPDWFMVEGFVVAGLLLLQGLTGCMMNLKRYRQLLRIQITDYMENTMRARLEKEYFHLEEKQEYEQAYFTEEEPKEKQNIKELLQTLVEEANLDRKIQGKRREADLAATQERARLFEEILKEYI